jgi:hypothetical protein
MKIYWKLKATSQEEVSSESGERSRSRGDVGLQSAFGNRSEFTVVGVQSGNDYINKLFSQQAVYMYIRRIVVSSMLTDKR